MKTKRGQILPPDIARAIRAEQAALAGFEAMPPSHQQAYLDAILEAKRPETRAKRLRQAVEMMAQWHEQRVEKAAARAQRARRKTA